MLMLPERSHVPRVQRFASSSLPPSTKRPLERTNLHAPIYVHGCARGYIVHFAGRADSSTIAYSTNTAATAKVSTELYQQRNVR